jgi:hypothetical protein
VDEWVLGIYEGLKHQGTRLEDFDAESGVYKDECDYEVVERREINVFEN